MDSSWRRNFFQNIGVILLCSFRGVCAQIPQIRPPGVALLNHQFTMECTLNRPVGVSDPLIWQRLDGMGDVKRVYGSRACLPSIPVSGSSPSGLSGGCYNDNGVEVYTLTVSHVTEEFGKFSWKCSIGPASSNTTVVVKESPTTGPNGTDSTSVAPTAPPPCPDKSLNIVPVVAGCTLLLIHIGFAVAVILIDTGTYKGSSRCPGWVVLVLFGAGIATAGVAVVLIVISIWDCDASQPFLEVGFAFIVISLVILIAATVLLFVLTNNNSGGKNNINRVAMNDRRGDPDHIGDSPGIRTATQHTTTPAIVPPRRSSRRPHRRNQPRTTPSVNNTSSTVNPQSSGTGQPSDRRNQPRTTPSVNNTSSTVNPQSSGTGQPSDRRNQPRTTPSVNNTSSTVNPQSSGTGQPSDRRNQPRTTPSVNNTSSTVNPQSSGTGQPSDRRNQPRTTPSVNNTSSTVNPQSSGTGQPSDRRNQPRTTPSVNNTSSTVNPQSSGTDQPSDRGNQPRTTPSVNNTSSTVNPQSSGTGQTSDRRNQPRTTPSVNNTSSTVNPQSSGTGQPSDRRNQPRTTPSVNNTSSTVNPQSSGTGQPSDRRNQPLTTINPQSSGTDQPSAISPQPSSGSSPVNQTPADISLPSVSSDRIREPPPPSSNRPSTADGRFDGMSDDDKDDDFMTAGSPGVFFRVTNDVDQTLTDFSSNARDNEELLEAFQALKGCLQGGSQIFVNRRNLLDDVFRIYDNSEITAQDINVSFLGESGSDFGGLSKDFLTTAWRELLPKYFDGEDAVVPSLPLYRYREEKDNYVAIGRFVSHSAAILEVLPPRLSRTSLLRIIFEDDIVSDDTLLEDFLLFLAPFDRSLVKRALRHFDILSPKQKSDLQDFFSIHQMQDVPKEGKIRQQILSIAQLVLVDRPAPLLKKMRQGIPSLHMETFWALLTTEGVNFIFSKQRPTGDKVANVITSSEEVLRPDEERCLYYLKQFVTGLDQEDLSSLLQFVTGSTLMPDSITISFRHVTGEMRCPIAHTCSNMLELPSTYVSLQDMKREFRSVLACQYSFEMSIL